MTIARKAGAGLLDDGTSTWRVAFGATTNTAVQGTTIPGPYPIDTTGAVAGGLFVFDATAQKFKAVGGATSTAVDYTVLTTDVLVLVTSTAALRTITLPTAASYGARSLPLVIVDASGGAATHNIVVNRAGADTINGATTKSITANWASMSLYCNGTAWFAPGF